MYLLDFTMWNALVLFKESGVEKAKNMNIKDFKESLMRSYLSDFSKNESNFPYPEHYQAQLGVNCYACDFYSFVKIEL